MPFRSVQSARPTIFLADFRRLWTTLPRGACAAALLALTACANAPEGPASSGSTPQATEPAARTAALLGVDWVSYFVEGVPVLSAPRPTLRFDGTDQVRGNGGCNQFVGKLQLDGSAMSFSALASTRMACMPLPSGQEDKFFKALEQTRTWKFEDEELLLLSASGRELMRLARQRP